MTRSPSSFIASRAATEAQVETEVRNLTELLMPAGGTYPLPENAVELEPRFMIPFSKGNSASKINVDANGLIYALDEQRGAVLVSSPAGELLRRLETRGKSTGQSTNPSVLEPAEILILQDIEARDLVFCDLAGRRLRKMSVPALHDFILDRERRLFTAPYIQDKSTVRVSFSFCARSRYAASTSIRRRPKKLGPVGINTLPALG